VKVFITGKENTENVREAFVLSQSITERRNIH